VILRAEQDRILEAVSSLWGLTPADLTGPCRAAHVAHPKQVAMYLIRKRCQLPLCRIGYVIGMRDHTTAMHGVRRITQLMATDAELKARVELIERELADPMRIPIRAPAKLSPT
jgi:chromosomal replication initiator protein